VYLVSVIISIGYGIVFTTLAIFGIKALEFETWAYRYYKANCSFYLLYLFIHIGQMLYRLINLKKQINN